MIFKKDLISRFWVKTALFKTLKIKCLNPMTNYKWNRLSDQKVHTRIQLLRIDLDRVLKPNQIFRKWEFQISNPTLNWIIVKLTLITILKITKFHKQPNTTILIDCSHRKEEKRTKACWVGVITLVDQINSIEKLNRDLKIRLKKQGNKVKRKSSINLRQM